MANDDAAGANQQTGLTNVPWHIFLESHFQTEAKLDEFHATVEATRVRMDAIDLRVTALEGKANRAFQVLENENKRLKAELEILKAEKMSSSDPAGENSRSTADVWKGKAAPPVVAPVVAAKKVAERKKNGKAKT